MAWIFMTRYAVLMWLTSETLKPREDIQFTKVYMSTYGENKNSNAFAGSADSSEVSESAVDSADTSSEM